MDSADTTAEPAHPSPAGPSPSSRELHALLGELPDPGIVTLADRMHIEILEATAERVVGRMPVEGNQQPYGLLHGGASVVLAETLGSVGSALVAGPGRMAVGVDINATHHRAATTGYVTGVATPISTGRTVCTYEVVITDDSDRRVCTSRITCLLRDVR